MPRGGGKVGTGEPRRQSLQIRSHAHVYKSESIIAFFLYFERKIKLRTTCRRMRGPAMPELSGDVAQHNSRYKHAKTVLPKEREPASSNHVTKVVKKCRLDSRFIDKQNHAD